MLYKREMVAMHLPFPGSQLHPNYKQPWLEHGQQLQCSRPNGRQWVVLSTDSASLIRHATSHAEHCLRDKQQQHLVQSQQGFPCQSNKETTAFVPIQQGSNSLSCQPNKGSITKQQHVWLCMTSIQSASSRLDRPEGRGRGLEGC